MASVEKKPRGMHIYQDSKGRYVYYDIFTRNGYIINASSINKYYFFQNRYILSIILTVLLATLIPNPMTIVGIGFSTVAVLEFLFRAKYLTTLTTLTRFVPTTKKSFINQIVDADVLSKVIMKVILYLALAILIVLNGYEQKLGTFMMVVSYAIGVFALGMSGTYLIAAIKMGKK
ncbi:MAG: hypothetical protein WBO70_08645 [Erysipelotrichaceae bacterium]